MLQSLVFYALLKRIASSEKIQLAISTYNIEFCTFYTSFLLTMTTDQLKDIKARVNALRGYL